MNSYPVSHVLNNYSTFYLICHFFERIIYNFCTDAQNASRNFVQSVNARADDIQKAPHPAAGEGSAQRRYIRAKGCAAF